MVTLLRGFCGRYKHNFTWKYFATSHGKGVVDGVGGLVKSLVRNAVKSRNAIVHLQTAEDFYKTAKDLVQKTKVIHVPHNRIKRPNELWQASKKVKDISRRHVVEVNFRTGSTLLFDHAMTPGRQPTGSAVTLTVLDFLPRPCQEPGSVE